MNSENHSHTIYRDHNLQTRPTASWPRLGLEDDRAEGFEVFLRVLLIVCVGAAMLTCPAWTPGSAVAPTAGAQCVAVEVAAKPLVRAAQSL